MLKRIQKSEDGASPWREGLDSGREEGARHGERIKTNCKKSFGAKRECGISWNNE